MNKKISLNKEIIILFIFNILIFFTSMILKFYLPKMNYYNQLVKGIFILNIIIVLVGIIFNIFLLLGKKYNVKKIIFLSIAVYIFFNVVFINFINNKLHVKYYNVSEKLLDYCESYTCDKYETINLGNKKEFIINKTYYDYNNSRNNIKIHAVYDISKINSVKAIMYSDNELYSEQLIYDELNNYFSIFDIKLNSEKIKEAFLNRDVSNVIENNINYKVKSIYKDDSLYKFKTIINVTL